MSPPIIQFDYDFSTFSQRTRLVLHAAGVAFSRCDQPPVLPRPDLEALGITYRRIPLLAVGKDIYCDSSLIIDVITSRLGKLRASPADKAFEAWGNATFQTLLTLLPAEFLTESTIRDRVTIFPMLKRSDYTTLRPSGLAACRARMQQAETEFLGGASSGPFMNGTEISVADIHFVWPLRWALLQVAVEKEPGFGREDFPKVWRLLDALPQADIAVISAAEAQDVLLKRSEYSAPGPTSVLANDLYGIVAGTRVVVESDDTEPGAHPQYGVLVATSITEVVIELENGLRLHFPRIGYFVRPA